MGGGKKGGEDDNGRCAYKYRLHCASSNSDTLASPLTSLLIHSPPPTSTSLSSPTFHPTPSPSHPLPPIPSSPTPLAPLPPVPPPPPYAHPTLLTPTPPSSHPLLLSPPPPTPSSPAPPLTPYPPILLPAHPPSTPTDYRCCVLACENSTIEVTARPSCHINSRMAISTY